MRNQLLLYCRKVKGFSRKSIARKIGISFSKYKQIETGEVLMSKKVAKRLSRLYKMGKAPYIYDAACQLDVLHLRLAIIRDLRQAKTDLLNRIDKMKNNNQSASKKARAGK
jgi:transcriptional regulator with XRE-family HTH domain